MRTAQISPVRNVPMAGELCKLKLIEPITAVTKNKS